MTHYRLYLLDRVGRIWSALDLECEGDADAERAAAEQAGAVPCELWQGARLVRGAAHAVAQAA